MITSKQIPYQDGLGNTVGISLASLGADPDLAHRWRGSEWQHMAWPFLVVARHHVSVAACDQHQSRARPGGPGSAAEGAL